MRILVLEYVTGGGMAGRSCPAPLAREGRALRDALVPDLALLPGVRVSASVDPRYPLAAPAGVRLLPVVRRDRGWLRRLVQDADAVWLIAPETAGRLARLATTVESTGRTLLGPASRVIRLAASRARLLRRLARTGLPVPETCVLPRGNPPPATLPWPAPLMVKPGRGAGGEGVTLVEDAVALPEAIATARAADDRAPVLLQRFLRGTAASVSLVCDGATPLPLALNRQLVRLGPGCAYEGGETPLEHALGPRALEVAAAACRTLPGLRGYVGVDLMLTEDEAVVLEINPRLTTSYLGLRRSLAANPAALALEAALGRLPAQPAALRRVHFRATGQIVREEALTDQPSRATSPAALAGAS